MDFFKKAAKLPKGELRRIAGMCAAAAALVGVAVLLSGNGLRSETAAGLKNPSLATPFGVSQGVPEYDAPTPYKGGYPSPLSCGYGGTDCYPYTKVATLSIYPQGVNQGQTQVADLNNNVTTVGGTPTIFTPGPLNIEWSCQPSQYAQRTCSYIYECGNWWRSAQCAAYYDCSINSAYANTSVGVNFSTGGALIGTTTVTFPTGQTSYTYTLQCKNSSGSTWTASVPVRVTNATLSLTANPMQVLAGANSTLTWATTGTVANSCTIVDSKGLVGARGLGTDVSGSNNSWTTNNVAPVDAVTDTPTNSFASFASSFYYSPTYGKGGVQSAGLAANGGYGVVGNWQLNSGKWYWEFTVGGQNGGYPVLGVFKDPSSGFDYRAYPGHNNDGGIGYYASNGQLVSSAQNIPITLSPFTNSDVIGVAYDADTGKVYFSKNGVWQNSANPAAGTGSVGKVKGGWPGLSSYYGKTYVNFGQGGAPSVMFYDSSSYGRQITTLSGLTPQVSNNRFKFGNLSGYFNGGSALISPDL